MSTVEADAAERARAERRAARERARAGAGAHGHDHDHDHAATRQQRAAAARALMRSRAGRVLAVLVAVLFVATIAGLAILWPSGHHPGPTGAFGGATTGATVTAVRLSDCGGPIRQSCRVATVRIAEGPGRGRTADLALGPAELTPKLTTGEAVRVRAEGSGGQMTYSFSDVDRRSPLWVLLAVFAVLSIVLARVRGVLALAGLGLSLVLVATFLLPAILDGSPALLVALVGSLAVMFVTLGLTYGVGAESLAAALGIATALLAAAVLGSVAVRAASLDGRADELQAMASLGGRAFSLQGVVLAGMVLGVLGVVTDMAVSQASAVMALRRANPALGPRGLYRGAFAVGRDHLSATVHTLVLAYVGASLPLLLVLSQARTGLTDALNGQLVAEPLVATLVGSIVLVGSVPLTTALAAFLAARVPVAALGDGHHGHVH